MRTSISPSLSSVRLALYSTEVSFKKEQEPWNYYKQKQFKFLNPNNINFAEKGIERPNYENF